MKARKKAKNKEAVTGGANRRSGGDGRCAKIRTGKKRETVTNVLAAG